MAVRMICGNALAWFSVSYGQRYILSLIIHCTIFKEANVWSMKTHWQSRSTSSDWNQVVVWVLVASCLYRSHIRKEWSLRRLINALVSMDYKFSQSTFFPPTLQILSFPTSVFLRISNHMRHSMYREKWDRCGVSAVLNHNPIRSHNTSTMKEK